MSKKFEELQFEHLNHIKEESYRILVLVSGIILGLLFTAALMPAVHPIIRSFALFPIGLFSATLWTILRDSFPLLSRSILEHAATQSATENQSATGTQPAKNVESSKLMQLLKISAHWETADDTLSTVKLRGDDKKLQRPYILFAAGVVASALLVVGSVIIMVFGSTD